MIQRLERRKTENIGVSKGPTSNTITDRTYRRLVRLIESRQIRPGEVLEERRWAERLRVSRTPLRAALSRLQGEGMLVRLSNGLPAVREVSSSEFLELLHLRKLLEPEATELAVGRLPLEQLEAARHSIIGLIKASLRSNEQHWLLDDQIHDMIAERCPNRSLGNLIVWLRRRARMCNIERLPDRLVPACREHLAIVEALLTKDRKLARDAMLTHLDNIGAAFLGALVLPPNQWPNHE